MKEHFEDGNESLDRLRKLLEEQHGKESFDKALKKARRKRERKDFYKKILRRSAQMIRRD